jgi:hypothetical protein
LRRTPAEAIDPVKRVQREPKKAGPKPRAIVLRGPPGVGKTTVIELLLDLFRDRGLSCARVHLDDGWGPGEFRRVRADPVAARYRDLYRRPEAILLVDLCVGEPEFGTTSERGASRNPSEWVAMLRAERDVKLVRLTASWPALVQRLRSRPRRQEPALVHAWAYAWINSDGWNFASNAGLPEAVIDAESKTSQQVAAAICRRARL